MDAQHWLFNELYKYYGQNNLSAKVEFDTDGNPIFQVGGKEARSGHRFKTLQEFIDFKEKLGLRRVDVFGGTEPISRMPTIGPSHYAGAEHMLRQLRKAGITYYTMERWSVDSAKYANVLEEMIRDGVHYGLPVPDDEKTQIFRFFNKAGEEYSSSRILSDLEKAGMNIASLPGITGSGAPRPLEELLPRLSKRLKDLMNVQEFAANGWAHKYPVVAFDATKVVPQLPWIKSQLAGGAIPANELDDFYKRSVEGLSILNPELVKEMSTTLRSRAMQVETELQAALGKATDPETKLALQNQIIDARKMFKTAKEMGRVAKKGGRLEGVRIREFLMSEEASRSLGLSDDQMARLRLGMIKGDALVPADWSATVTEWNSILKKAVPGFKGFNEKVAGLFAMQNITQEFGGQGVGREAGLISGKINHAVPIVRSDIQSMAAYGRVLYDHDAIEKTNKAFIDEEFKIIEKTKRISPKYERALREISKLETSRMTSLQKQGIMRELGTRDILELENRIVRAKRILARLDAGVPIFEDKTLLREITEGILDTIRPDSLHAGEPRFIMPNAYRAHITTRTMAILDGLMDQNEELARNTAIFRGDSIIFGDVEMHERYRAHGGWDLDDLLAQHLRYFEGSDTRAAGFYAVNFRSPGGLGELSTMKMDLARSSEDIFGIISKSNVEVKNALGQIVIPKSKKLEERVVDFEEARRIRKTIRDNIDAIEVEKEKLIADKKKAGRKRKGRIDRKLGYKNSVQEKLLDAEAAIDNQIKGRIAGILNDPTKFFTGISQGDLEVAEETARAAKTGDLGSLTKGWAKYWTDDADALKKAAVVNMSDMVHKTGAYPEIIEEAGRLQEMLTRWESAMPDEDEMARISSLIDDADDATEVSKFLYRDMVEKGTSPGILGRYSNAKMMADDTVNMLMEMEKRGMNVPSHLKGIFRPTEMEEIIDLIVQGVAQGSSVQLKDVGQRAMSMVDSLAQVAAAGVKLDPRLFETRMKPYQAAFKYALNEINPDIAFDDVFLNMDDAAEAELASSARKYRLGENILGHGESSQRRLLREASTTRKEIMETLFEPKHYDEADAIAIHLKEAQEEWDRLRMGLEATMQDSPMFGYVPGEDFWDVRKSEFMHQKFQDKFLSYFDKVEKRVSLERGAEFKPDLRMGDDAQNIFGAFLQRHGARYGYLADGGDMGNYRSEIEQRLVDQAQGKEPPRVSIWASDFRDRSGAPGTGKQAVAEADAALSSTISRPIGKASDLKKLLKGLTEIPKVKKGLIGAGLLVAGSMLYQSVKQDVPQEELEGMPNMPGGNFYTGDSTIPPQGPPQVPGAVPTNGVTYRVNASGNYDPAALSRAVEQATGAPASGQIYSRPRYDPYKESRIIDESF